MAEIDFDNLLNNIELTSDPCKLLVLLIELRKHVAWPVNKENINKLRRKGTLKIIVASLVNSKRVITDVSLSILGNCCLDEKSARDVVGRYNILSNLNQLVKKYPRENSINGRVFRIIGNICQHGNLANKTIEEKSQLVTHTVNFLKYIAEENDPKIAEATIIMGLRVLRELVNYEVIKKLVADFKVLESIGLILIKYGPKWSEHNTNGAIIMNLIKLLLKYSLYRHYPILGALKNTGNGDALICLTKIAKAAPKQVVKIIMNFLHYNKSMSELPVVEIFQEFSDLLRNHLNKGEINNDTEEYIGCLCKLLHHPANRTIAICGESIKVLIEFLQILDLENYNERKCSILIITALNKCIYDDSLIETQIQNNIIKTVTDKLILIVNELYPLKVHKNNKKKKRKIYTKPSMKFRKKIRTVFNYDDDDENFDNNDDDDCDENEDDDDNESDDNLHNINNINNTNRDDSDSELTMSWTSGLSPLSSPRSDKVRFSESDSDDYSPVCSDAEEDTNYQNFVELDEKDDFFDNEESNDGSPCEPTNSNSIKMKIFLLTEMIKLLRIYSGIEPPIVQLCSPELLLSLVKTSMYLDRPTAYQVVSKIIAKYENLLPLMTTNFIPRIFDLINKIKEEYSRSKFLLHYSENLIDNLEKLAESEAGRGDIAHKLLRGDNVTKQLLVLVLPYLVTNRLLLGRLMLNCGGLEILLKLLMEESELKKRSIKALYFLATKGLNIINPNTIKNNKPAIRNHYHSSESTEIVRFKLDDGSVLRADRKLLSQHSDFFSCLLNGDFKESKQNEIALHNVVNRSFKQLLRLMRCDIDKNDSVKIDLDLVTLLDLIVLCDRFLMPDFCVYLLNYIERYQFSSDTVPKIYKWSLESKTNLLRVECVAFALVAKLIDSERFQMFQDFFDSGYSEELIEDLRTMLVRHLKVSPFDHRRRKGLIM